jgi:hypothetical protein
MFIDACACIDGRTQQPMLRIENITSVSASAHFVRRGAAGCSRGAVVLRGADW